MTGIGPRTAAACPGLAAREPLYTPDHVVEAVPGELRSPSGAPADAPDGRVLALVRLLGHPLGTAGAAGALGDTAGLYAAPADAAHRQFAEVDNPSHDAAELLFRERCTARVRDVREPMAGLTRAHNRGQTVARGRSEVSA
jgi:hypothetical protein